MITEEDIDGLQIANVICAILRIMVIVSDNCILYYGLEWRAWF